MSKLVTFEQKQNLKKLGFDFNSICTCGGAMDCICKYQSDEDKLITVSDALDWLREEKGIVCGVYPLDWHNGNGDFVSWDYTYSAYDGEIDLFESITDFLSLTERNHSSANSALLTAVLNYLIEKEK